MPVGRWRQAREIGGVDDRGAVEQPAAPQEAGRPGVGECPLGQTGRLRTFCGRSADDVTCIATSATMADPNGGDQAAADFARRFFGVDGDKVTLVGEHYEDWAWPSDGFAPTAPSRDPADILTDLLEDVERDSGVGEAISDRLIELGGLPLPSGEWQPHLTDLLRHNLLSGAWPSSWRRRSRWTSSPPT